MAGVMWTHFEERCFCESILQAPTHCLTSRPLYPWRLLSEIALVHSHFPPRKCLSILQDSSWVTPYAHTILPPPAHSCFPFSSQSNVHLPFLEIILLISLFSLPAPLHCELFEEELCHCWTLEAMGSIWLDCTPQLCPLQSPPHPALSNPTLLCLLRLSGVLTPEDGQPRGRSCQHSGLFHLQSVPRFLPRVCTEPQPVLAGEL